MKMMKKIISPVAFFVKKKKKNGMNVVGKSTFLTRTFHFNHNRSERQRLEVAAAAPVTVSVGGEAVRGPDGI